MSLDRDAQSRSTDAGNIDGNTNDSEKPSLARRGREILTENSGRDVWWLLVFLVVVSVAVMKFDALQVVHQWIGSHGMYEPDKFFGVLIIASLSILVFVLRRHRDLVRQMKTLERVRHRMRHLEMHDPVTDLPNRSMGKQLLARELARSARESSEVAVFSIDIDRFKQLNESYGQHRGDEILRAVALCLQSTVRGMDTLVRMGADEFMIIQSGVREVQSTWPLAQRLVGNLSRPLELDGLSLDIGISIGIAISSNQHRSVDELIRYADLALARAKTLSGISYQYFELEMDALMLERQQLESDFRAAMENESFFLHYQPLFNVNNRQLLGFEALLRWHHPQQGNISPAAFIPIAEDSGLIVPLGTWVLERACADAMRWSGEHKIAVNLSPVQFRDANLPAKVSEILERTGLAPQRLELEITEGVLVHDVDTALQMLLELKALGVRISMDDFGTGYSSLSYLKRFPFDKIKIDRSFVGQLDADSEDAAIVRAILAMGHSLGMIATAEGVESKEQLSYLFDEGCDEAQGFLLGRPMPFEQALLLTQACLNAVQAVSATVLHQAANDQLNEAGGDAAREVQASANRSSNRDFLP